MKLTASLLLILAGAGTAFAAEHSLQARISNGKTVYSQTIEGREGSQQNFVGKVEPERAGPEQQMIMNVLVAPAKGGQNEVQYQLELSGGRNASGRSIQGQGSLRMRSGDRMTAISCGPWRVELGLDAPPAKRASKSSQKDAPDPALKRGNYRVTASLEGKGGKMRCSQALSPGSQGNVVDGTRRGGKRYGSIMNLLAAPAKTGEALDLQYQLEFTPDGKAKSSVQAQSDTRLTLGRSASSSLPGYKLQWLAEGAPRPTDKKPPPSKRPAQKETGGSVPLLR